MTDKLVKKSKNRTLSGVVVSDKMKDTCVVEVNHYIQHPKYKKYYNVSKNYKVHDVGNTKKIGEKVSIIECAPISKHKHFKIA
jgi:small subunit ribosomal protein S17